MLGKSSIKPISAQTPENIIYILKLIAHQKLGSKWIYFRKIKRGDQGLSIFREKSLMEQMKATRAALRFTTRNARKLYRLVYQETIRDIKIYTGLKTEFPELQDDESGGEIVSLNSEHDATIISWTPIKFLLPVIQLRAKGSATQRHTEGLAAKLFFKVAGYYANPLNWDRYKLNLYVRRITQATSYQEIAAELEPLKSDLDKFVEAYELFKFGKASLSKDVAMDKDAFDDAMGIESFESQLNTLYWYQFIYMAMEQFVFRYYLTLVSSTVSQDAVRYLTSIFEPVLQKAIENRNVFLGSFETDRTKRSFRIPYQKLVKEKLKEPLKKNIKTQMGIFETYTYNLTLLEQATLTYEIEKIPELDSVWSQFLKHYLLDMDHTTVTEAKKLPAEKSGPKPTGSEELQLEKQALTKEKETLFVQKKEITSQKGAIKKQEETSASWSKEKKIELQERKTNLLNNELKLDQNIQKLKEKFKQFETKQDDAAALEAETQKRQDARFTDPEVKLMFEKELSELPLRQFVLMNIMTTMINCTHAKRQARYKILERFKDRVQNDQELEAKRIEEIRKKAEKKLRDLKKRMSKMDRLKQNDTVEIMAEDINKFEKGVEQRIDIIKKDSIQQLRSQKQRLNALFDEIAKEKTVNLGETSRLLWKLITQLNPEDEFRAEFPSYVSKNIQSNFSRELEPFYKNIFNIFDLPIKEKIVMIQSLEKANVETSVKLLLNENEEKEFQKKIDDMKAELLKQDPDLFSYKIVFLDKLIPISNLFNLNVNNKSVNTLLILKVASPKMPQHFTLKPETVKALIELNSLQNPLPKYSVIQAGKEKEQHPEKRINPAILNSLLAKIESK